uniref:Replication protein A 70 kDa DNA-binding subunit B/D first OB fold domain-containing protein n=1 Tax=Manihot esculenta TaxID=3983 RepID=A0A2C9V0Z6_MANES
MKGDTIQGFVRKQDTAHFKQLLTEGEIYHILRFIVLPCQRNYRLSRYSYHIKLPDNAFVKELDSTYPKIPFDCFSFLNFKKSYDNETMLPFNR